MGMGARTGAAGLRTWVKVFSCSIIFRVISALITKVPALRAKSRLRPNSSSTYKESHALP